MSVFDPDTIFGNPSRRPKRKYCQNYYLVKS